MSLVKPTYEELERRCCEAETLLDARNQVADQDIIRILESISDAVFVLDEDLCVTWFSPAGAQKLGCEANDLIGKPLFQAFPEARGTIFEATFTEAIRTRQVARFETYFEAQPYRNWYEVRVYPRESGLLVCFVITTERKQAEEALRASETRFRLLYENSPLGYQSLDADGRFIEVNQAWLDTLGYKRDEVIGHWFGEFLPPQYVEAFRQRFPLFKQAGEVHNEFEMIRKDGTTIVVGFDGKIGYDANRNFKQTHCILHDITQRKRAEEALRQSEEKYRALVEGLPDIVMRFDRNGRHLFVSSNVTQIVERDASQFIGKTHRELGFPESQCCFWEEVIQRAFDSGQPYETEFSFQGEHGLITHNWRIVPERDESGQPVSVLSIARDVTAHRRAEREYQALFRQMLDGCALHEIILDERGEPVNYRFLAVNPAFERLTGLKAKDIVGKTVLEVFPGIEPRWIKKYGHVALTGDPVFFEERASELNRRFAVTAFCPAPNQFACIFHDITELTRAEEAVREVERLQRAILDNIPDPAWLKDRSGRFLAVNEAWCRWAGKDITTVIGKTDEELLPPHVAREFRAQDEEMARGGPATREEECVPDAQGRLCWFETVKSPIKDDRGEFIGTVGIARDITSRKQAEEALRESEANIRYILKHDPNAIAVYDENLRYIAVSDRFVHDYGVKESDLIGKYHYDVFPEMPQRWKDVHQRVLAGAVETNDDDHFVRSDGSVTYNRWECRPWYRADGTIGGMITYTEVTTERKLAELALRESEASLKTAQEMAHIGSFRYDVTTDTVSWSDEVYRLFGIEPIGRKLRFEDVERMIHPDDLEHWRSSRQRSIDAGGSVVTENRIIRPDGTIRYQYVLSQVRVSPENGEPLEIVGTVQDITERVQAEQERAKLEQQLLQAQKMESVGRLAGGVAHDFNNMLQVIQGHAELALGQTGMDQSLRDDLQQIQKAAEHSAKLTRQLLAFARKQTVSPKILDLNETVAGTLKMLQRLIGEDIKLDWKPGTGLWPIRVDPTQLDQILANLAVNARDAMPEGGKLIIETRNAVCDEDHRATHAIFVPGDYVQLVVSDTGTGMDKSTLEHLFEPFFTTKGMGKGTGLGLATVYGILKQNDGFVNVYSEPGRGTTFTVYLPRYTGKITSSQGAGPVEGPSLGHETVLFVEDEPAILRLGKMMLEQVGYRVLIAGSPAEAIRIAERQAGGIHLLITDVVMPEMNGRELANCLVPLHPELKCLFMSGYTADVIAHHGLLEEGVQFIQKPFSMQGLAGKVRELLMGK